MKKTSKKVFQTPKKTHDFTSVYIAFLSLVVIIVVFFLAYVSKMSKLPKAETAATQSQQAGTEGGTQMAVGAAGTQASAGTQAAMSQQAAANHLTMLGDNHSIAAGTRVKFKIDHFKKLALQPLDFEVFDENGKAYTPADLQTVNQQNMHFIVVSANLREFQHLRPNYQNGKWHVLADLPTAGTYYAYIDITPVKGSAVVLRSKLVAQKETVAPINYPGLTPNLFAITNGFKAQLSLSQAVALQQSVMSYHVSLNGKAAVLGAYLGNLGHVLIFRQGDVDSLMHVHALSASDAKKGLAEFMTTFVKGGRYTAFAEFKIGARVYVFAITFDING